MNKKLLKEMSIVLVLLLFLSGCFLTGPINTTELTDITEINTIDDSFSYKTTRLTAVDVSFPKAPKAPLIIYAAADLTESSFYEGANPVQVWNLYKAATVILDDEGRYSGDLTIPLIYNQIVLSPLHMGMPDSIIVDIDESGTESSAEFTFSSDRSAASLPISRIVEPDPAPFHVEGDYTFYSEYDDNGYPADITDSGISETDMTRLLQDIAATLPEYKENTDRLSDASITLDEEANVSVTFMHEGAGYRNAFSLIAYDPIDLENGVLPASAPAPGDDLDGDNSSDFKVIFPNASLPSAGSFTAGDTLDLGLFPGGKTLIWAISANGYYKIDSGSTDGLKNYYSYRDWNPESEEYNQHLALLLEEHDSETDEATFVLGFEDLKRPYGDDDFNDLVVLVNISPASAVVGIEEDVFSRTIQVEDTDNDGISDTYDMYPDNAALAAATEYSGYIAFEDQWPAKGDYDFNDLVASYNYMLKTDADNYVRSLSWNITIEALGAGYRNGLAMKLPIAENQILDTSESASAVRIENGDYADFDLVPNEETELLPTSDNGVVIKFFEDANLDVFETASTIINTEIGGIVLPAQSVSGTVYFTPNALSAADLGDLPFDLFLIQQNGIQEIHLPDLAPSGLTPLNELSLNDADDDSDPALDRYYKTENNLPWALHIPSEWDYPIEKNQIISAYRYFAEWAGSDGSSRVDWYVDEGDNRNYTYIYQ